MEKSSPEELSGRTWKIKPVPVPSDDCVIYVGREYGVLTDGAGQPILEDDKPKRGIVATGEPVHPHAGETLWLLPITDMATYTAIYDLDRINRNLVGNALADAQEEAFAKLAARLADHIAAWNWTDLAGDPMPQPYKNPDVLAGLDSAEFGWIVTVVQEGPPAQRKGFTPPSPTTSSARAKRRASPSSDGSAAPLETASPA